MKKTRLFCCSILLFVHSFLLAQKPKLLLPIVVSDAVDNVVVSPDDRYLLGSCFGSGRVRGEVKVWDIRSNTLVYTLPGNSLNRDEMKLPCFSGADPRKFVTRSEDKLKLLVRNVEDGSVIAEMGGFKDIIESFGFDHSGTRVIATSNDSTCRIFDVEAGKLLRSFSIHQFNYPAAISQDDQVLATCDHGEIRLWDTKTGNLLDHYEMGRNFFLRKNYLTDNFCQFLHFSKDGKFLLSSFTDSTFYIRDIANKKEYELTDDKIVDMSSSWDGLRVILLTASGNVLVYDLNNKRAILEKGPFPTLSTRVSMSGNGSVAILSTEAGDGYTTTLVDISSGNSIGSVPVEWPALNFKSSFSRNGNYFYYRKNEQGRPTIRLLACRQERPFGKALDFYWKSKSSTVIPTYQPGVFASYSGDSLLHIWDIQQGKIIHTYPLQSAEPVFINKQYLVSSKEGPETDLVTTIDTLILSDIVTGKVVRTYRFKDVGQPYITPDNKYIVTGDGIERPGRVIELATGKIVRPIEGLIHYLMSGQETRFIPGSDLFMPLDMRFRVSVCNFSDPSKIFYVQNYDGKEFSGDDWLHDISFPPGGRFIASVSRNKIKIWNTRSGKPVHSFTAGIDFAVSNFSPAGDVFYYALSDGTLFATNTTDFSTIKKLEIHRDNIYKIFVSSDSKYLLTADDGGMIVLWSASDLVPVSTFRLPEAGKIESVDFENGRMYFSQGGMFSCYELSSGAYQYSLSNFEQGCIFLIPQNYYRVTRGESTSLAWQINNRIYSFDQFDLRFNRPDLVLQKMGNKDTALVNMYRGAYYKRLKKINVDTITFNDQYKTPEADFANRNDIAYEQAAAMLPVHIYAADNDYFIDRVNILVNETPVFGLAGINIRSRDKHILDTTIKITLSAGENRMEVSVINEKGVENFRYPLYVRYNPSTPVSEKIYFAGIGIGRFADGTHKLQYCEKDIRDLAARLKEKYGEAVEIDTLFDEDVSIEKVRKLKEKLLRSREDDKVIIAYSGHGLLSKNYDYYLSTYGVNFDQPEQNGLPYSELENLVDGIRARKKLMLIDACHSGELDKEEMQKIAAVQAALKDSGVVTGAKGIDPAKAGKLGAKNSFELMQELFVNVGRGTGTTVISAAAGTQFALERGELKNGVFTYSVLELLKNEGPVTVNELKKHVSKRVSELTKGLQQPTTRNEIQSVDWEIW